MIKLSTNLVVLGFFACLIGAIWSPEEWMKWVLSALYLLLVGKYFGLSYRKEKIVGVVLRKPGNEITNLLPMRKLK